MVRNDYNRLLGKQARSGSCSYFTKSSSISRVSTDKDIISHLSLEVLDGI